MEDEQWHDTHNKVVDGFKQRGEDLKTPKQCKKYAKKFTEIVSLTSCELKLHLPLFLNHSVYTRRLEGEN